MSSETTGSTGLFEFLAWLEENKKRLATAFVIAIVAGFAIYIYRWKSQQTELAANEALLKLRTPSAGEKIPSPPAAEYLKIASEYSSTDAAERALLLGAGTLFTESKFPEAQVQFERFLKDHSNHSLASAAAYGRAASLEAQGKSDDALTAYQGVLSQFPQSSVVTDARFAIARLFEGKKQPEMALRTYEEMTRTNSYSGKNTEALMRKELLLAKYPELAKANTNTPAISMTNSPAPMVAPSAATTNSVSKAPTNTPATSATNTPPSAAKSPKP
jgi:predicted negative regulator of RcsB-dependent stress response